MTWEEFQREKKAYKAVWAELQGSSTGALKDFLKKSYLMVVCGRQFNIDDDPMTIAKNCPAFFVDTSVSREFFGLLKALKAVAESSDKEDEQEKRLILKEISRFDHSLFAVIDHWRVHVRFPVVDIDLIQELKTSPYCDKEKTMMRPASINVVLKKTPESA
ncbi:MAG: hypothetical protein HQL19_06445 [Candidatus Omnitrophica bacterium]|nr:hypothetical protein [Candidatus Omnitrophota bacterium]